MQTPMNKTQHTPGPWSFHRKGLNGGSDPTYAHIDGEGWSFLASVVVQMRIDSHESKEGLANARLIAAAPELLEALEEIVAISDRDHDAWTKARAAIAKAKGVHQ